MSDANARGFLDHIIAHPDDDSPRLVFADWLEEHGDPDRAEFIRAQIERAKLPAWEARAVRLRIRERVLLDRHGTRWRAELPVLPGVNYVGFRRGFVAEVTFSSFGQFKQNVDDCRRALPLEAVTVRWPGRRDGVERMVPVPELRELTVTGSMVDLADAERLAASPLLSTLRELNARDCALGVEGFRRLLASPHLKDLTALRVPENGMGDGGVTALVDAKLLPALKVLDLSEAAEYGPGGSEDPFISPGGLRELASWPGMAGVRALTLSGCMGVAAGLRALLGSPYTAGLKELHMQNCRFHMEGLGEFVTARPTLRLDILDISENGLHDEAGASALAEAACLGELKELRLGVSDLFSSGARELAKARFFDTLRRLDLSYNEIGPDGVRALVERLPGRLHTLKLGGCELGDEGVRLLAERDAPPDLFDSLPGGESWDIATAPPQAPSDGLLCLDVSQNGCGRAAWDALSRTKHLRSLLALRFGGEPADAALEDALRQSPLGRRLEVLELSSDGAGGEDTFPY